MPDDLTNAIAEAAQQPAEATGDGGSMKARTIDEMIKADQYAKANAALDGTNDNGGPVSAWSMTRPARVIPPGSV